MSKKAGFKDLSRELAACGDACQAGVSGSGYLIARFVRDIPDNEWQEFCKTYSLSQWFALHLPACYNQPDGLPKNIQAYLDDCPWILDRAAFKMRLGGELLRIARSGGAICLLLAKLADRRSLLTSLGEGTVRRLDTMLKETIEGLLEACDCLCEFDPDTYGVVLPGLGQLKSRRFAENVQRSFMEIARPFFPTGGINAGSSPTCAIGLVNVVPGEISNPAELLERAKKALDSALDDTKNHIYQESPTGDACGATLVHSNEKHFLFFGGEPK
jgi:FOG: GGDEF domain